MKIAILGPGAMGMLFGSYLSRENEVTLIGRTAEKVEAINAGGVTVTERDGTAAIYRPCAAAADSMQEKADLVIVQVKAMASRAALDAARGRIGPDTILLTLQNGAGHEELLREYAPAENVAVGITQEGAGVAGLASVRHSGAGKTYLALPDGDNVRLAPVAKTFCACGFDTEISGDVKQLVWAKLMINASSSVLSGVLQMPQGFAVDDPDAFAITEKLVREICAVANADGQQFDADAEVERIRAHNQRARAGLTSIYADLRDGRLTEVDTITGSVVRAGRRLGVPVPTGEMILSLVHAMEKRAAYRPE